MNNLQGIIDHVERMCGKNVWELFNLTMMVHTIPQLIGAWLCLIRVNQPQISSDIMWYPLRAR